MRKIAVVFLGAPGSGKGTQARILKQQFHFAVFSAGETIRTIAQAKSKKAKSYRAKLASGTLFSDKFVLNLFQKFLKNLINKDQILLDGLPRNLSQAKTLRKILPGYHFLVFYLAISPQTAVKRASSRRTCLNCGSTLKPGDPHYNDPRCLVCRSPLGKREDQTPEVISQRLKVYQKETAPLIDYYQKHGELLKVNGEPPIKEVADQIRHLLVTKTDLYALREGRDLLKNDE